MGLNVDLTASDAHRLGAYLAEPARRPRGGIVVIQEIFGVTQHIRDVADQYAAAGYLSIAPALFDRVEAGVDVAYNDVQRAMTYAKAMQTDKVMLDLQSAIERIAVAGRTGVVGYCWGGTMAYIAAARLNIAAAVAYYGGGIDSHLGEKPRVPVMFHYGEHDTHIPATSIDKVKAAYPQGTYHLYPAGHGFNCTHRASYEPTCAGLAFDRSLEFLHNNVG